MPPINEIYLEDEFKRFDYVKVKHDVRLSAFQYVSEGKEFLNTDEPSNIAMMSRGDTCRSSQAPTNMVGS